jgi:hypothetical protein
MRWYKAALADIGQPGSRQGSLERVILVTLPGVLQRPAGPSGKMVIIRGDY